MAKKKTSSHFQAAKDGAEKHNERLKELSYVRKDLSHLNAQWKAENFTTVSNARKAVEAKYHKAQGKKLPKNATPIQETVVVIQEGTTMEQLQNLASKINEAWGYTPLAIYIHRDEGHVAAKEWSPNLHAHMIFDTTDENGKTLKPMSAKAKKALQYKFEILQKERAARGESVMKWEDHPAAKTRPFDDLQDITAECLGMARGKASKRKHLDAIEYKIEVKSKEIEQLDVTKAAKETTIGSIKAAGEWVSDALQGTKKALQQQIKALQAQLPAEREKGRKAGIKEAIKAILKAARLQNQDITPEKLGETFGKTLDKNEELKKEVSSLKGEVEKARKVGNLQLQQSYVDGYQEAGVRVKGLEADVKELIAKYANNDPKVLREYSIPREDRKFDLDIMDKSRAGTSLQFDKPAEQAEAQELKQESKRGRGR